MNIAFDVDGVVLKSIEVILASINRARGLNLCPDDLASWELEPLGLDETILREAVTQMYDQPWIEPYEGALQSLSRIYRVSGKPLLFITGRSNPATARKQLEALPWNPVVPEMIVTGGDRDKRIYLAQNSVSLIVEDDVKHIRDYVADGFDVGLMLQPWNRNSRAPVKHRFNGWKDLENWFMDAFPTYNESNANPSVVYSGNVG